MARVSLFVLLLLMRKEVCCCNKPTAAAAAIQAEFGPSHRSLPAAAAAAAQNLMMTDRALEVRAHRVALEVRADRVALEVRRRSAYCAQEQRCGVSDWSRIWETIH